MSPAPTATPLDARIDAIAQRQTARYLDRQEHAGESSPEKARDFKRAVRFICEDIKAAVRESCKEAVREPAPQR